MSVEPTSLVMANEMRAALKRLCGRGPEHTQVMFAREDTIVVLFDGVLTNAERTLLTVDCHGAVVSARAALHQALEPDIRAILERNIGRDVHAFLAAIDVDRDVGSFVITLR